MVELIFIMVIYILDTLSRGVTCGRVGLTRLGRAGGRAQGRGSGGGEGFQIGVACTVTGDACHTLRRLRTTHLQDKRVIGLVRVSTCTCNKGSLYEGGNVMMHTHGPWNGWYTLMRG